MRSFSFCRPVGPFNLNGEVGDTALDRKVSKRLARYLLRPAMAESRIVRYEPGAVAAGLEPVEPGADTAL